MRVSGEMVILWSMHPADSICIFEIIVKFPSECVKNFKLKKDVFCTQYCPMLIFKSLELVFMCFDASILHFYSVFH